MATPMATRMATLTRVMAVRMSSRPTTTMATRMMIDQGMVTEPTVRPPAMRSDVASIAVAIGRALFGLPVARRDAVGGPPAAIRRIRGGSDGSAYLWPRAFFRRFLSRRYTQ